jgi:hypothetical protein
MLDEFMNTDMHISTIDYANPHEENKEADRTDNDINRLLNDLDKPPKLKKTASRE